MRPSHDELPLPSEAPEVGPERQDERAAIGTMVWRAAARVGQRGAPSPREWSALLGAVAFATSDALIALDRFHGPVPGAHAAIILLYWGGQLGIALSSGADGHPHGLTAIPERRSVSS